MLFSVEDQKGLPTISIDISYASCRFMQSKDYVDPNRIAVWGWVSARPESLYLKLFKTVSCLHLSMFTFCSRKLCFNSRMVAFCLRIFSVPRIAGSSKVVLLSLLLQTGDITVGRVTHYRQHNHNYSHGFKCIHGRSLSTLDSIYTERYMGQPDENDNFIGYEVNKTTYLCILYI